MGEWVTADSGYKEAESAAPFFFFSFVFFCVLITLPTTSTLTTRVAYGPQRACEKEELGLELPHVHVAIACA